MASPGLVWLKRKVDGFLHLIYLGKRNDMESTNESTMMF